MREVNQKVLYAVIRQSEPELFVLVVCQHVNSSIIVSIHSYSHSDNSRKQWESKNGSVSVPYRSICFCTTHSGCVDSDSDLSCVMGDFSSQHDTVRGCELRRRSDLRYTAKV